ncbi:type II toxin-antitoxin system RelE/ParE family toxin [Aquitalea pelogenes]|uniref:type II toxin-antitoxin system RelE/ParE family toxin n=1 Tax=Aquitalea pelogenes TaxID=1293573 RepID=UPI0035AF7C17
MTRKVIILDIAKADFREIRKYVKREFGDNVWEEVNQEFKNTIQEIGNNPEIGSFIEELENLGLNEFRKTLVRQSRVIYEFDDEKVIVHMFIHTRQDFRTHLEKRILKS